MTPQSPRDGKRSQAKEANESLPGQFGVVRAECGAKQGFENANGDEIHEQQGAPDCEHADDLLPGGKRDRIDLTSRTAQTSVAAASEPTNTVKMRPMEKLLTK